MAPVVITEERERTMQTARLASDRASPVPASVPGEHRPVMCEEVVSLLGPCIGGDLLDGTLGDGGHAAALLSAGDGCLLGLDRDPSAVAVARSRLAPFAARARVAHADFGQAAAVLDEVGWSGVDGLLLDLGFSSRQVEAAARGFSFMRCGPLDMRMDTTGGCNAADIVNTVSEAELRGILHEWGEEKAAATIAKAIARARRIGPITTTTQLARIIERAVGRRGGGRRQRLHPATRTFQALRIAVNQELDRLASFLETGYRLLRPGGRLLILSYHSLEDRRVKAAFRRWASDCICPPRLQVCTCNWTAQVRSLTTKPITPTAAEILENPRARSARLRAVERCKGARS